MGRDPIERSLEIEQAQDVVDLISDPKRCQVVLVTLADGSISDKHG